MRAVLVHDTRSLAKESSSNRNLSSLNEADGVDIRLAPFDFSLTSDIILCVAK